MWHCATVVQGHQKSETCKVTWDSTLDSDIVKTNTIDFTELTRKSRNRKPPEHATFAFTKKKPKKTEKKKKKEEPKKVEKKAASSSSS